MIRKISAAHLKRDIIIKMIKKISVSRKSTLILSELQLKLKLRPNILARNALILSLENGERLSPEQEIDTSGKEFNSYTLFGSKEKIFEMILRQCYGDKLEKMDWGKMISFHVEAGLNNPSFVQSFG